MTNYDITAGLKDFNYQSHSLDGGVISRVVDFAKFTTTGVAGTATDTADVINIPLGYLVEECEYKILVASTTSSSTFGVGDSASSTYFFPNTTDATATAGTLNKSAHSSGQFKDSTSATTLADSTNKLYTAADKIRIVLGSTAPLNGKVQIIVRGVQTV